MRRDKLGEQMNGGWEGNIFKERPLKSSWVDVSREQGTVDLHVGDLTLR